MNGLGAESKASKQKQSFADIKGASSRPSIQHESPIIVSSKQPGGSSLKQHSGMNSGTLKVQTSRPSGVKSVNTNDNDLPKSPRKKVVASKTVTAKKSSEALPTDEERVIELPMI